MEIGDLNILRFNTYIKKGARGATSGQFKDDFFDGNPATPRAVLFNYERGRNQEHFLS